jgi:hypothetical protein
MAVVRRKAENFVKSEKIIVHLEKISAILPALRLSLNIESHEFRSRIRAAGIVE